MKNFNKIIFWIIIGVFIFSSFLAFASFSIIGNQNNTPKEPMVISQEEKEQKLADKIESQYGKNLEGVLHKVKEGEYKEGTHYLEVDGIMLSLLQSADPKINLDDYEGENVKVWGETSMTQDQTNTIMKVIKIE